MLFVQLSLFGNSHGSVDIHLTVHSEPDLALPKKSSTEPSFTFLIKIFKFVSISKNSLGLHSYFAFLAKSFQQIFLVKILELF